ncbi:MAG: DDE-type integrase/transposase/recombinase [Gomphosphaeria aponina SAG 52.96 = DSM 107014]|uniref:DDE-type integrase/transposase/recombinase n=1 Tax=Gomphosphaeria aponina SAG 52.96 = DSM 107014 TaxID=1521640 RepID=A0A941JQ90_9CHRO|nr:DDE-type integrase/transposase/recombinase [Gomphosphaeria aponina SAG 52.96 = DSM 107014]
MAVSASHLNQWRDPREDIVILCVRWYLSYSLSYRQLEQIMLKRGLSIQASTFYRLVRDYSRTCQQSQASTLSFHSWRVVQTFVNLQGNWKFLYRAVDPDGNTLDFFLLSQANPAEATKFFAAVFNESSPELLHPRQMAHQKIKNQKFNSFTQKIQEKFKLKLSLGMIYSLLFFLGSNSGVFFLKTEPNSLKESNQNLSQLSVSVNHEELLTDELPKDTTALASLQTAEKAFLDTIAWAEGTLHSDGYRTLFGGKVIEDLSKHPNICVPYLAKGRRNCSTAFGRYQILNFNSEGMSFEPAEQDKWAIAKLQQIGVLSQIHTGNIEAAIIGSCKVWSSLPCHRDDAHGYYGQPTKPMTALISKYQERLKLYE